MLFLTLLYSIHFIDAFHAITPLISPRKDRSSNRIIEISIACLETRSDSSAVVEKVFFLEVRPVFCYWINPRPPLDAFYRPTLIEMSLENGCARVLFNRPRWFFSSFFLPSRWSFVIVPFFPRLRSRERPSRTSANYLQLEIREEEKKGSRFTFSSRFRIDFQRRLF